MNIPSDNKKYECEVCHKKFNFKTVLSTHLKVHAGIKNFKCDECKKLFLDKDSLKRHMVVHTKVKAFKCKECGKEFAHRFSLSNHVASHRGVKKFAHDQCDKAFVLKSSLRFIARGNTSIRNLERHTRISRLWWNMISLTQELKDISVSIVVKGIS